MIYLTNEPQHIPLKSYELAIERMVDHVSNKNGGSCNLPNW